jgi:hypothetical protein
VEVVGVADRAALFGAGGRAAAHAVEGFADAAEGTAESLLPALRA